MSTSAAKFYTGDTPIGNVTKGRFRDNDTVNFAQLFGTQSANESEAIEKGTFITTDKDGNLEHLDANPWIKSMHQQILEKLRNGKITEAYDQLQAVKHINAEYGLNLEDVLIKSLEHSKENDLLNVVSDGGGKEATIKAFSASDDGLASLASTMALEELLTGSPRFVCEDYRAKEMQNTQQAYEEHLKHKKIFPALAPFIGRD